MTISHGIDFSVPIGRDGTRWRGHAVFETPLMRANWRTLVQFALNNYTNAEVAALTGISERGVESGLRRARARHKVRIPYQAQATDFGSSSTEILHLCQQGLRPAAIAKLFGVSPNRIYTMLWMLRVKGRLPPASQANLDKETPSCGL